MKALDNMDKMIPEFTNLRTKSRNFIIVEEERNCSISWKKNIITWHNLAMKAVKRSTREKRITLAKIQAAMGPVIERISSQKFELPNEGRKVIEEKYQRLNEDINISFRELDD
ncbi:v-type proton atpase catalytic subunit a [Anaeramoeba ignava]|uniref:V-type proton atpase catalytic subunit a n=1 Tax=Anaeramoeba ignava TaxID=1746090 RepID=A0A9Q0RFC3_ANAIG|nr:v-type proton atpase catalytic subunit a [Anaeramoeba ignava]